MTDFSHITLLPHATVKEAMQIIDSGRMQLALVVDNKNKLIAVVTDGDVRRGILAGVNLDSNVLKVANHSPVFFRQGEKFNIEYAKKMLISRVPVVDSDNCIIDLYHVLNHRHGVNEKKGNIVVLMAGGLGTRLRPLTHKHPKPLLDVGEKPILETIIKNFAKYGFSQIYLSVNYKAEMIKAYFGDGSRLGVDIRYLEEKKRLGTAGALSLLDQKDIDIPFFVMNGDLLTTVDFQKMLDYHYEQDSSATVGVREYDFQVPYGVIKAQKGYVQSIQEKPVHRFFVNAGIYLLNPDLLQYIPRDTFYDMPTLISALIDKQQSVSSFPIHEYWLDIGRIEEYNKANSEYNNIF